MANEKKTANQKKINDSLDLLNRQVSDLYTTTYSTVFWTGPWQRI